MQLCKIMKKTLILLAALCSLTPLSSVATICPDPNHSSLQWGEVPLPWEVNPFSEHQPQGEENAHFIRANILLAGSGRGIVCTYAISIGYYSIWWQVPVKIPAPAENNWRRSTAGYECTHSIVGCVFYPA